MEYKDIDNLIEKYFDGQSSLEEEQSIRNYLKKSDEIPEKHQQIKQLFVFHDGKSTVTSKLRLDDVIKERKPKTKVRNLVMLAVAASIVLLISVFAFNEKSTEEKVYAYINGQPVMDQQVAFAETQKALMLISNSLNGGTEDLKHLAEFGKVEEMLAGKD